MKQNVLFLCSGNSARSQMAEAFLKKYAGIIFGVYSAGLEPQGIHPYTVRVMEEIGVDLSGYRSKNVQEFIDQGIIDILITVCDDADKNCPTGWPGIKQRLHWSFQDPAAFEGTDEKKIETFRQVRDQINQAVKNWLIGQGIPV